MTSKASSTAARGRRRATAEVKSGLRELSVHLTLLNRQVGGRLGLKEVDLDCLDLINAHGPLTPTALARQAGLHRATLTGVLDRLERAGWASRDRDPDDRRAVQVRALRDRNAELLGLFAGMNTSVDEICGDYENAELERFADFLHRTAEAGRKAADDLADK
ncbi:MarR family winged helix-turn-helix transcriptional regulator [Solicola gregarius]|uniref:MarR family transcriptional regulator n=1 Tax=Solicola gregarius TaxID=2908642 RepID=A0AA46TJ31_9ACTN|nr:MarR family transcriptional regulator [Solicola gregarius]UYM05794.1 MarR family transcriptional regulator [Solicola gregarius]